MRSNRIEGIEYPIRKFTTGNTLAAFLCEVKKNEEAYEYVISENMNVLVTLIVES